MIDHVKNKCLAEPEEVIAQKIILNEKWDVNQHIKHMYERNHKTCNTLREMNRSCIHIWQTRTQISFKKKCITWKKNPAANRATEQQLMAHFNEVYKVFI